MNCMPASSSLHNPASDLVLVPAISCLPRKFRLRPSACLSNLTPAAPGRNFASGLVLVSQLAASGGNFASDLVLVSQYPASGMEAWQAPAGAESTRKRP